MYGKKNTLIGQAKMTKPISAAGAVWAFSSLIQILQDSFKLRRQLI